MFREVLGQLPPSKSAPPPTLKPILTLTQTLTLTGVNFPRGQLSGYRLECYSILNNYAQAAAFTKTIQNVCKVMKQEVIKL